MKVLVYIISLINKIIPKKKIILFESFPDFSDNSYALYKYILENREDICKEYQIVWAKKNTLFVDEMHLDKTTYIINKKSLKGYWTFLRAKYVISTHGYFQGVRSGNGQVQINLWHGCGYKSIAKNEQFYKGDYTIVTGEIYKRIHSELLGVKMDNVWVTGLPRNDAMFSKGSVLNKLDIDKSKYRKILVWMPTYRKASLGHSEIDGDEKSFGISSMNVSEYKELNTILEQERILLIVKPHPMDALIQLNIKNNSNIRCITNQDLAEKKVTLYELLANIDGLLSDYSSVIIDFMLLDKPIAMVLSDLDSYKESRGFVFNPIKEYMPGPIISNLRDLINYFERIDEIDLVWKDKRSELNKNFHKFIDSESSKRVCEKIWGVKGVN